MSLKKTNDNRGSYRGAGHYSKDYATFDRSTTEYSGRDIGGKVLNVGDYDGEFTGPVSRSNNHPTQGKYSRRGDGPYSPSIKSSGKQGKAIGGQKVSD